MRKSVYMTIAVLMLVMALAGCGGSVDERLVRVCGLADANEVDSAKVVLNGVCRDDLDEHNRYYYDLMSIKTRDKGYEDITGDTIITDIVAYFEGNGNDAELGEAYYYGGRVSREQGDAPQALDYYQKAIDALQKGEHVQRKGKIASQMGQIFLELYLFDQAKEKFQEAIAYQTACGDSVGMMYNYKAFAETLQFLNYNDSVLFYYDKALSISKEVDKQRVSKDLNLCKIDFLLQIGKVNEAIEIYRAYIENESIDDEFELKVAININLLEKNYNEAEKCAYKLLEFNSINSQIFAYSVLANIKNYKGNDNDAYLMLSHYRDCVKTDNAMASKEALIHQNSFYNYALRERENLRLQGEQRHLKYTRNIFALIIVIIFVLLLWIYERNKSLKRQLALQLSKINQLQKESDICDEPIDISKVTVEDLKTHITQRFSDIISGVDKKSFIVSDTILDSLVFKKFNKRRHNNDVKITNSDWSELDEVINKAYPMFKKKIYMMCEGISYSHYCVCMLIKCKFAQCEIADIVNMSDEGVSSIRRRLCNKCSAEKNNKASDWDKFIYSL